MILLLQMVLALRYLHKGKGIVHRDLTPNNIMLGELDKVTISKLYFNKVYGIYYIHNLYIYMYIYICIYIYCYLIVRNDPHPTQLS